VNITIDSTGKKAGTYIGSITINSNDASQGPLDVQITLITRRKIKRVSTFSSGLSLSESNVSAMSAHVEQVNIPKNSTALTTGLIVYGREHMSSLPQNPYMDIGNDSDAEWTYSGAFDNASYVSGFESEINDYLYSCTPVGGNCTIPIVVYSDTTGTLGLADIMIVYNESSPPPAPDGNNTSNSSISTNVNWNLISPPSTINTCNIMVSNSSESKTLCEAATGDFFNPAMVEPIMYSWDQGHYNWHAITENVTLEPGRGYWLKSLVPLNVTFEATSEVSDTPVYHGWNLFGISSNVEKTTCELRISNGTSTKTLCEAVTGDFFNPAWVQPTLYSWDGSQYMSNDITDDVIIKPEKGYWIKLEISGGEIGYE